MFQTFGTMLNLSRNAIMTVDSLKKWMDLSADLGYDRLLLYMEDVYEVEGQPYFGYARGRYSKAELKELDAYAQKKGMTLMPCIQTLAHMERIFRWPQYAKIQDGDNTMLVGDEDAYALIRGMLDTIAECFTTKKIHIGMDEAFMLGRGKYFDLHGHREHMDIMLEHLNRVSAIGKEYGFTFCIWSDMIYTLATGDRNYHSETATIQKDVKALIPENVELVYWDYYTDRKERYDYIIKNHHQLCDNLWFAGGLWTFIGFALSNRYTIDAAKTSLASCNENGVQNVIMTAWSGDGSECSRFAILPSLFYIAELAKGNTDEENIKKKFREKFNIDFDDFMLIDLLEGEAEGVPGVYRDRNCPSKYILFNDLFLGLLDSTISEKTEESYKALAEKLLPLCDHPEFGYLFTTLQKLCVIVSRKATLGQKIRKAYLADDKMALQACVADAKELIPLIREFYQVFRNQWRKENKPFGFEVHDARFGGLLLRTEHCITVMEDYLAGKITWIPELEEERLDVEGKGAIEEKKYLCLNDYKKVITTSAM